MEELKIFIVEDDQKVINGYDSLIRSFNKTSDKSIKIVATYEKDIDAALDKLRDSSFDFDGAIVDLDLKNSGGFDSSGNEVIKEVIGKLRFPIFVITGTVHNLDKEFKGESSFFKVRSRDQDFDFIEEFIAIYNTGITKILNRKGTIEKYITDIFWNHLSNSLDLWINDKVRTFDEKHKSLLRYTLLHIQEYLELTANSDFENYHPAEIYITPPIKNSVFTGDIVQENGTSNQYIVLTPSCDLAQLKANIILVALIEPSNSGILAEKINLIRKGKASEENIKQAKDNIKSLIKNSYSNKYHYLPEYNNINSGLVNFQKVYSFRHGDFNIKFTRIATINSSFTKDIVARFSYYYSRQGSPDFNVEEVFNSIIN